MSAAEVKVTGPTGPPGSGPPQLPPGFVEVEGVILMGVPGTASEDVVAHTQALLDLEMRPDDVIVCAIPKAGTHWVWEMASMLTRGKAEHDPNSKEVVMLEFVPTEQVDNQPSPRVLNSHLPFRVLPRQVRSKKTKLVLVSRNPKDVAVSTFHHVRGMAAPMGFQGSFSEFLRTRFFAEIPRCMLDWFWMTQDWEKVKADHPDHPILQLRYEDLKEDLAREVGRLAKFLEVEAGEGLIQDVARACSFSSMKKVEGDKNNPHSHLFEKGFSMYRKGEVGDWKNWFTVADNELFDETFARRMKDCQLEFRYTL